MATTIPAIRQLSDAVRSQIKSSVEITSLSDVVERLLHNSLDANSTDIRIEVDFARGFCAIVDNGCGIPASEFGEDGNLGRPYCTSKSSCNTSYGNSGQSLALISALAMVSITSCTAGGYANRLLLRHRTYIHDAYRGNDDTDQLGASGTSVTVQNLFGNLPVRFKLQAMLVDNPARLHRQFHQLKMRLVAYLLSLSRPICLRLSVKGTNLSFTHKGLSGRATQTTFSANVIQNVMRQAGLLSATEAGSWKLASARANGLRIRAAICMEPRPSKEAQFISLACQPIRRTGPATTLFDTVNDIFEASKFGIPHQATSHESKRRYPMSRKEHISSGLRDNRVKGADRWPCFYIRIDAPSIDLTSTLSSCNEAEDATNIGLQQTMALLTLLIEQILQSQQLMSPFQPTKRRQIGRSGDMTATQIAKNSFNGWTRTRAAYPSHVEDFRQGLPFVDKAESPIAEVPVDTDVQLLIDDIERDGDGLASTVGSDTDHHDVPALIGGISSPLTPAGSFEDVVTWTNPQTGKTIRLNSNRFAVPQGSRLSHDGPADAHGDCRKCFNTHKRLPKKPLPVRDMSERLRQWSTSTFSLPTEAAIPSVAIKVGGGPFVTNQTTLPVVEETLSAQDLAEAEVLGQVDEKFILVRADEKLVLIDQHAADERIKVEALYKELCSAQATPLKRPILVECSSDEARRFDQAQAYFASWAIFYGPSELAKNTVRVTQLPSMIAERCRQEPKILIDMLRKEVWTENRHRLGPSEQTRTLWVDRMVHCPADLLDMINSRACRSAVMFNDVLTIDQCTFLVRSLAQCILPFQCAHGRPSLAVLTNLEHCGLGKAMDDVDFGHAFRSWI